MQGLHGFTRHHEGRSVTQACCAIEAEPLKKDTPTQILARQPDFMDVEDTPEGSREVAGSFLYDCRRWQCLVCQLGKGGIRADKETSGMIEINAKFNKSDLLIGVSIVS